MNRFSKQIFEIPEQYILFTSSDLIFINKKRPIDELFKIILESEGIENLKNTLPNEFVNFLNKYGISETSFMLLVIFSNYALKFNLYEDSLNMQNFGFVKAKENSEKLSKDFYGVDFLSSSGFGDRNAASAAQLGRTNTFIRQIKNNENFMRKAFDFYMRLIDYETVVASGKSLQLEAIDGVNFNAVDDKERNLEHLGFRPNAGREVDYIGRPIIDLPNLKINRKH